MPSTKTEANGLHAEFPPDPVIRETEATRSIRRKVSEDQSEVFIRDDTTIKIGSLAIQPRGIVPIRRFGCFACCGRSGRSMPIFSNLGSWAKCALLV
jgi:hypothetical protein